MSATAKQTWDLSTQVEHGGQTWALCGDRLVADFSVTTCSMGPPQKALEAARAALVNVDHYPNAACEPALSELATHLGVPKTSVLLGNGASELIDLVVRMAPAGAWRPGPHRAQYMEYERACTNMGRARAAADDTSATLTIMVNPSSPTEDYVPLDGLRTLLESLGDGQRLIVDESFLPFMGAHWREQSALRLLDAFPDTLIIIHSWTKIWTCPGIRVGSVSAGAAFIRHLKKHQVPWSCSTLAQSFLRTALADDAYLQAVWSTLPVWKRAMRERLRRVAGWEANAAGPDWVPWLFVDVGDAGVAARFADAAFAAGCPVRHLSSHALPSCLRFGIHAPDKQDVFFAVLEKFVAANK